MWDDVTIGSGNRLNSAIKVFDLDLTHDVSENGVSYWIRGGFLDCGMTIFKNTPEGVLMGERIKARQDGNYDAENFDAWLEELLLKHMPTPKLKTLVHKAVKRANKEGSDQRAAEIRKSLGIGHGF